MSNRFISIFIVLTTVLVSCNRVEYHVTEGFTQGTTYRVIYSGGNDFLLDSLVVQILEDIDNSLSVYNPNSIISKVNRGEEVEVDTLFINVFNRSKEVYELSEGAFDVSASPLFNMWGFGFSERESISQERIDSALALTGMDMLTLNGNEVVMERPGMTMNFNAIAKGYTSDVIAQEFDRLGIENYLVEVGGEIVCKGKNSKGKRWSVGVDKPIEGNYIQGANLQDVILMRDGALATSGNYRRFYEEDGKIFSHTISPITGYPVRDNLLSATVLAKEAMTADAFATWFMVVGLEKAIEIIEKNDYIEGYLIYSEGENFKVYKSSGITIRE